MGSFCFADQFVNISEMYIEYQLDFGFLIINTKIPAVELSLFWHSIACINMCLLHFQPQNLIFNTIYIININENMFQNIKIHLSLRFLFQKQKNYLH